MSIEDMYASTLAKQSFHARMDDAGLNKLVSVDLRVLNDTSLCLEQIWSEIERRNGHATRALKLLLSTVDEYGVQIQLTPHWLAYDLEFGGHSEAEADRLHELNGVRLGNEDLRIWYEKYGFVCTERMIGDDPEMIRESQPILEPAPFRARPIRNRF